jgi:hypothetical protein
MLSPPPGIFLPPDLLVSVLNAVIDIYADEGRGYDRPVFVDGGFLQALTPVVEVVRANVRLCLHRTGSSANREQVRQINKRTEPALRAQAAEAYRNLIAFIQYRRNLRLWSPNVDGTL